MRVLLVGGGAREHALAEAILRGPEPVDLIAAPGNAGIARVARCVALPDDSPEALVRLALEHAVDLVVIGPEGPLVLGAADALRAAGIPTFGPGLAGAQLEGSKARAKEFLRRHHVPTADFRVFESYPHARSYVTQARGGCVVKADGLAAGKGVFVSNTGREAEKALHRLMVERTLGDAGATVVVEERLEGAEASLFLLMNGREAVALPLARDFKRLLDGDNGPNTGGMGAVAPHPMSTPAVWRRIQNQVIEPIVEGLAEEEIEYRGLLYVGLMLTEQGPNVLEFNCRFGDPETQPLTLLLDDPWLPALHAAATGGGMKAPLQRHGFALGRVIAGAAYPTGGGPQVMLRGLDAAARVEGARVFHAGTRESGEEVWGGPGRMLTVCAVGDTLEEAGRRADEATACLSIDGAQWRTDLVERALDVPRTERVETRVIRSDEAAHDPSRFHKPASGARPAYRRTGEGARPGGRRFGGPGRARPPRTAPRGSVGSRRPVEGRREDAERGPQRGPVGRPRPTFADRPPRRDQGDRPPRRDFSERPPRRDQGDRPPRRDFSERPPRRDQGEHPPRARAPRPGAGSRPGFAPRSGGARPFRPSGPGEGRGPRPEGRAPRREFIDRPPRREGQDRPPREPGSFRRPEGAGPPSRGGGASRRPGGAGFRGPGGGAPRGPGGGAGRGTGGGGFRGPRTGPPRGPGAGPPRSPRTGPPRGPRKGPPRGSGR